MNRASRSLIVLLSFWLSSQSIAAELAQQTYQSLGDQQGKFVDQQGNIGLPKEYLHHYRQHWTHLGSWIVDDNQAPGYGFHDVYTQPEAAQAYRDTGEFPDGTVLVKEVRGVESGVKTTGQAHWAGGINVWFVMVKDSRNRFSGNNHWGEGWGWALLKPDDPGKDVSASFSETCQGCHVPAKNHDWVFVEGYPTLTDTQ